MGGWGGPLYAIATPSLNISFLEVPAFSAYSIGTLLYLDTVPMETFLLFVPFADEILELFPNQPRNPRVFNESA